MAEGDPLELAATPSRMRFVATAAKLSSAARDRALDIATATPDPRAWQRFLSRALALLGAGLCLAGVVCYVAYNWASFGRFGKFALIEAAIAAATLLAWKKLPGITGQVALFAAAVLVGPLLAVYGQTYQTGADPYGLFLTWFALIIPWVIVARFSALWILALGLLDLGIGLFWSQVISASFVTALVLPLLLAAIHAVAIATWEWQLGLPPQTRWLDEAWAPRIVAATGFLSLFIVAAAAVVSDRHAGWPGPLGIIALAAAIAGAFQYYRKVRADHFMVTAAVSTGMAWVTVAVGRLVLDVLKLDLFGFFVLAGFVIWEITLGLKWYRAARRPVAGGDT